MTKYPDLFAALCAPFDPAEVKTRDGGGGRKLHYITARTAMNRLDKILGPENWWDDYVLISPESVMCRLTIRLPDGQLLTKVDVGGMAGMADAGDDDKSGFSDSIKRAAVKFGVGRYFHRDGVPDFAAGSSPSGVAVPPPPQQSPSEQRPAQSQYQGPPRSGRGLFAWVKDQEQQHGVGLLKYLNNWSKLQEYPGRMVDWTDEQVALAYAEACRKLQSVAPAGDPAPSQPQPQQPPRINGASPGDDPLRLRMRLIHLIWEAARARHDTDKNVPEHYWVMKSELDNHPDMGGEIIPDVNSCEDVPLLKRAVAAAERLAKEAETPF